MRIAILPGDGIGPEVTAQAVKVLRASCCRSRSRPRRRRSGGAGIEARGDPAAAERRWQLRARRRRDPLRRRRRPRRGRACRATKRPGDGLLRLRKELELFANFRPGLHVPGAARRLDAEARGGRGPRPRHPARAQRRHLFRRAARHRERRRRASASASTRCATRKSEMRAHRPCRVPRRARAPAQGLLGRQGERAGDDAALARGRDRGRHASIPTSS